MSATLLRIELRRNTVVLLLPVLAALVWFSPTGRHLGTLALWPDRGIDLQNALQGMGPLFAGAAAWIAGRERRRGLEELLTTTPRSPWTRLLTMWAATTAWGVLFYVGVVAVVFGTTALQATWGGPALWPPLVGLLTMPALAALGFALGHGLPSRFTPALVAVGVFVVFSLGIVASHGGQSIGDLAPIVPSIAGSVWYASRPDLGLVQAVCLLGVSGVGLGVLGLSADGWHGARRVARAAVLLTALGIALTGASVALINSSQRDDGGVRVPFFGGATSAAPLPYVPVCSATPLPICVHPAYRAELRETALLLNRLAAPVLGLPGAPDRAAQQPVGDGGSGTIQVGQLGAGRTLTVLPIALHDPSAPSEPQWVSMMAMDLVATTPGQSDATFKAQTALALYLVRRAGEPVDAQWPFAQDPAVQAAARRFAVLRPGARQHWLRAHYWQLRQGNVRLEDLP